MRDKTPVSVARGQQERYKSTCAHRRRENAGQDVKEPGTVAVIDTRQCQKTLATNRRVHVPSQWGLHEAMSTKCPPKSHNSHHVAHLLFHLHQSQHQHFLPSFSNTLWPAPWAEVVSRAHRSRRPPPMHSVFVVRAHSLGDWNRRICHCAHKFDSAIARQLS